MNVQCLIIEDKKEHFDHPKSENQGPVRSHCVWWTERQRVLCTQKALLYWLHWTGLDWSGLDQVGQGLHQMKVGVEGVGVRVEGRGRGQTGWGFWGGRDQSGMQPSLRQHKQHADTVTGNIVIIIIILLFKVSLKTSKLYKKEENRFFALMKNTFFDFFSLLQRRF